MSDFIRIIAALQQQMNATFSRSDVLRPLHIMLGTMVLFVLGLAYAGDKVPTWAFAAAFYALMGIVGLEAFAYLFCLIFDRDSLRSERYRLQKMAIEARLLGDETAGLFEVDQGTGTAPDLLPAPSPVDPMAPVSPKPVRKPKVPKGKPE